MPKIGMEPIRRKQIIKALLKCIAHEGIDKVTLDKAAKEAGVSKGVVAYYFKNKEELLIHSYRSFLNNYSEMIGGFISSSADTLNAMEMLRIIGQATLGLLPAEEGELTQEECKKILVQLYSKLTVSPEYREMVNLIYSEYMEGLRLVLDFGIKNKEFSIKKPEDTAIQIMALLEGLVIYSIIGFAGSDNVQYEKYVSFLEML